MRVTPSPRIGVRGRLLILSRGGERRLTTIYFQSNDEEEETPRPKGKWGGALSGYDFKSLFLNMKAML
jgi:hypothetical protein